MNNSVDCDTNEPARDNLLSGVGHFINDTRQTVGLGNGAQIQRDETLEASSIGSQLRDEL